MRNQLLEECQALASFALSAGKKIPGAAAQTLEALASGELRGGETTAEGKEGSPGSNSALGADATVQQLTEIHGRLAEIVAPATPRSVIAMQAARKGVFGPLGSVRLLRRMMWAAGLSFLLAVVPFGLAGVGGLSPIFNSKVLQLFLYVAAAGLGASFFALFKANRYVVNNTFDPHFEPTYWVRFALGVIAGTILGAFIDVGDGQFAKPTLAALGGFSADAVQRILNKLVEAISSLVRGEPREIMAAQEQALKADLMEQSTKLRFRIAGDLVGLQRELYSDAQTGDLHQKIQGLIDDLIGPTPAEEGVSAQPAEAAGP